MEDVPAEQPGVMAVVKHQADSVIADGLDAGDGDMAFAGRRGFLAGTMALNLGRRRFHAQQFGAQRKAVAIFETDMKGALVGCEPDFGRQGGCHQRRASRSASLSSRDSSRSMIGTPARTGKARPS